LGEEVLGNTVLDFQVIFAPGVLVGAPFFSASSLLLLVVSQLQPLPLCLSGAEIQRLVLFVLVKLAKGILFLRIQDSQHSGNGTTHNFDFAQLRGCSAGLFGNTQLREFHLQSIQLLEKLCLRLFTNFVCYLIISRKWH